MPQWGVKRHMGHIQIIWPPGEGRRVGPSWSLWCEGGKGGGRVREGRPNGEVKHQVTIRPDTASPKEKQDQPPALDKYNSQEGTIYYPVKWIHSSLASTQNMNHAGSACVYIPSHWSQSFIETGGVQWFLHTPCLCLCYLKTQSDSDNTQEEKCLRGEVFGPNCL